MNNKFYKIEAIISLILKKEGGARVNPFYSGYNPVFSFVKDEDKNISGSIYPKVGNIVLPESQNVTVDIYLSHGDYLLLYQSEFLGKEFGVGSIFTFFESPMHQIGKGEVTRVIGPVPKAPLRYIPD